MSVVLQLSDLHLGRLPEHEPERIQRIAQAAEQQHPDLIVISGDLCDDAPCQPDQLQLGQQLVDALAAIATVHVVPGNHDIGNKPGIENDPLTPERHALWEQTFGPGHFRQDLPPTAVLGLNSQILGSGWPQETQQHHWLEQQLADCEHAVVFMHMPPDLPALVDIDDARRGPLRYWPVDPEPRAPLLKTLASPKVRLLCTGHLHNDAALPHATPPRRWCPSLSFAVHIPGVTGVVSQGDRIGMLRHDLNTDPITSTLINIDPLPVANPMRL